MKEGLSAYMYDIFGARHHEVEDLKATHGIPKNEADNASLRKIQNVRRALKAKEKKKYICESNHNFNVFAHQNLVNYKLKYSFILLYIFFFFLNSRSFLFAYTLLKR